MKTKTIEVAALRRVMKTFQKEAKSLRDCVQREKKLFMHDHNEEAVRNVWEYCETAATLDWVLEMLEVVLQQGGSDGKAKQ